MDEPVAVLAASAFTIGGMVLGVLWQRGRAWREARRERQLEAGQLEARLDRIEQIGEAMAVEIERVSEGQRFTTRLLSERMVAREPAAIPLSRSAEYRTPH
jgi:hypothetical protein